MFVKSSNVVIVALLGFSMAACSGSEPDAGQITEEAPAAVPTLARATSAGLRNARQPMDHMVTGAQPSEAQVAQLVDAGFDRFISLRPTSEDGTGWEEAGLGAGASFARLPIRGGADLTRENVEALDALLRDSDGEDTVLYCASGNRVGAFTRAPCGVVARHARRRSGRTRAGGRDDPARVRRHGVVGRRQLTARGAGPAPRDPSNSVVEYLHNEGSYRSQAVEPRVGLV